MGTESSPPSSKGTAPAPSSCRTAASVVAEFPAPSSTAPARSPPSATRYDEPGGSIGPSSSKSWWATKRARRCERSRIAAGASAQPAAAPGSDTASRRSAHHHRVGVAGRSAAGSTGGNPRRWSPGGVAGGARGATAHHRHVRQIDLEAVRGAEGGHDRIRLGGADLGARPQSAQYTCPWSASGPTWNSSRPSAPWPCRTRPSSSSASSVRYTVDGMVCGSRSRQRSMSSALVTCPLLVASTSITVRRCGVQRIPRSWNCSRTPDHGSGSDADRLIAFSIRKISLLQ